MKTVVSVWITGPMILKDKNNFLKIITVYCIVCTVCAKTRNCKTFVICQTVL